MIEKILQMIREINPFDDFDENTMLIEDGILDSLTLVLLIGQIEGEFSVKIPEDGLDPANFETVNKIAEFIQSLQ